MHELSMLAFMHTSVHAGYSHVFRYAHGANGVPRWTPESKGLLSRADYITLCVALSATHTFITRFTSMSLDALFIHRHCGTRACLHSYIQHIVLAHRFAHIYELAELLQPESDAFLQISTHPPHDQRVEPES
jgi:hypothetical protein